MSLRRLLNVVYAVLTEGKDEKDLQAFDTWLESTVAPSERPKSRGTANLMAVVGGLGFGGMPSGGGAS